MPVPPSIRTQNAATILLVDDNHDGTIARRSVLETLGYKVVSTRCGADALEKIKNEHFDLVVTDYKMSPVGGVELIKNLRQENFGGHIILLSGFADTLGLTPENTGADIVIQKSANELNTLLRHTKRLLTPSRKPPGAKGGSTTGSKVS